LNSYREAETKVAYPLSSGVPQARTVCFFWVGESPVRVLNFGRRRYSIREKKFGSARGVLNLGL
jgi:hypothetical protein